MGGTDETTMSRNALIDECPCPQAEESDASSKASSAHPQDAPGTVQPPPGTVEPPPYHKLDQDTAEENPAATGTMYHGATNLTKAFLGAASFELPWALKQSGIWAGSLSLLVFAMVCAYTLRLLGKLKLYVQVPGQPVATYEDVGQAAFGNWGRRWVNFGVVSMSLGVCSAYLVFVASTMHAIFVHYDVRALYFDDHSCDDADSTSAACMAMPLLLCLPIAIPFAMLKDYSRLAFVSVAGIALVCASMVAVVAYGLNRVAESDRVDLVTTTFLDWKHYPLFFGNAAFLFCIHTVAIPIHTSTKQPADYNKAVNVSTFFVSVLNIGFAMLCFWIYGDDTKTNIVQNLPADSSIVIVIKILLIIVMIFTFALFIQPLAQLLEQMYMSHTNQDELAGPFFHYNGTRLVIIAVTCGLALSIPDFGLACNLVGAVANTLVGVILPASFNLKLRAHEMSPGIKIFNIATLGFGLVLMVTSAVITVISIVCVHSGDLQICHSAPFDAVSS